MSIPLNFNPLGYTLTSVGELPSGYTRLAFVENTGAQNYRLPDYNTADWSSFYFDTYWVHFVINYRTFLAQFHPTGPTFRIIPDGNATHAEVFINTPMSAWTGRFPCVSPSRHIFTWEGTTLTIDDAVYTISPGTGAGMDLALGLFTGDAAEAGNYSANIYRILSIILNDKNGAVIDLLPAVDAEGKIVFYNKINKTTYYATGEEPIAGIETLEQLTALSSNLPSSGGAISLSLPGEWNGDESANAQLSRLNNKNWVATITYRDVETSSSSSFVFGNRGDGGSTLVLWCKVTESEYGNYQNADGVRYFVETCHDVWHPDGMSPDDLGYTAALTLEDYLTERGLTAVTYEEEVLTANLADISL